MFTEGGGGEVGASQTATARPQAALVLLRGGPASPRTRPQPPPGHRGGFRGCVLEEGHQFNPISSSPRCCVGKIKRKAPLFDGQKAGPCSLTSRGGQHEHPAQRRGEIRSFACYCMRGKAGVSGSPSSSREKALCSQAAPLASALRSAQTLPPDLLRCKHVGGIRTRRGIRVIVLSR